VTEDTLDSEIASLLAAEQTIRDLAAIIAEHKPPFKEAETTTPKGRRSSTVPTGPVRAWSPLVIRIRLPDSYPCTASAHDPTPRELYWGLNSHHLSPLSRDF
jgi:hypothetical protein